MFEAKTITAVHKLVNSPGFVVSACLCITGFLIYYLVIPIPQKLDELILVVKSNQCKTIIGDRIHDTGRNDPKSN